MTDALEIATTTLDWSRVEARGPESETFLQGQLSQDLTDLDSGGAWSALLAPDSVVVTSGWLARAADGYDFVVPTELAEDTLRRLRRFLLRAKCTLELAEVRDGPYATLGARVAAGWPGPAEFAASLTPHCFGQFFVGATISFQKGCFTGQELVGRLDARGSSVPWRLVRVSGPSREAIEDVLRSKGPAGPQGLTSAVELDGRVAGLGFAHRTLFAAAPWASGVDVTEVP